MKHSAVALLRSARVPSFTRTLLRRRAVVLTYHGVLTGGGEGYEFLNHNFVPAQVFDRQMRWVREQYRPLPLSLLVRYYRDGQPPPPRSIAITFDDGFANNYSAAFPILQRYGIPFTVFLTTGLLDHPGTLLWTERVKRSIYLSDRSEVTLDLFGREVRLNLHSTEGRAAATRTVLLELKHQAVAVRDAAISEIEGRCGRPSLRDADRERFQFLSWDQVRSLAAAGVEFGSHTVNHPIVSRLDGRSLEFELRESKRRLETELARPCDLFAYPNGSPADFGEREKQALAAAGYAAAFALTGRVNRRAPDLYALDRVNIGRQLDDASFDLAATGLLGLARDTRAGLRTALRRRPDALRPAEVV
jgi:peptidoglycan/xylan/chitin deacetylase (PgdA/CDA1 family)